MNNDGDFYIGNKLINSSTGKEETFDIPVPTITGQDPARLSVVFDEVIVKERILVEGGKSKTILSEFDGPVNFDKEVKINDKTTINGLTKLNSTLEVTDTTQSNDKDTGCVVLEGGLGVEKNVNIGGNLNVSGVSTFVGVSTFQNGLFVKNDLSVVGVVTIGTDLVLGGELISNSSIVSAGGTFGNIQIAVTNDNTIDTKTGTGNLIIDSAGGTIDINDNVDISGNLVCGGTGTFTGDLIAFSSSDINLKENLVAIPNALTKVGLMTGYTFDWKSDTEIGYTRLYGGGTQDTGIIAQQVDALGLPGITTTREDGTMAVRYEKLVPILINAIQELEARVKTLEG